MSDYLPINEGRDHINIYSKSGILLGRQLSNFYHAPFKHPIDGPFNTVEGYWYWLKTGCIHDNLRTMTGPECKFAGKTYTRIHIDGFNDKILEAIRCKLRQNRDILQNLTYSSLPLTHYYYYGKIDNPKIVRLNQYNWIVEEFERIRTLMKQKLT